MPNQVRCYFMVYLHSQVARSCCDELTRSGSSTIPLRLKNLVVGSYRGLNISCRSNNTQIRANLGQIWAKQGGAGENFLMSENGVYSILQINNK